MAWTRRFMARALGRGVCFAQVLLLLVSTSCLQPGAAPAAPGLPEYQEGLALSVPGGRVNLAGGNLMISRVDLSIDTHLGTREIGATYNSASGEWLWSFELYYDGRRFVDDTGASRQIGWMPPGSAIPGSHWVKLDGRRVATRGGLVHTFDQETGRLIALHWIGQERPSLTYVGADVFGVERTVSVLQCRGTDPCRGVYSIEYDEHGCVERIEDRAGRVALFEQDASCKLLSARDGLDVARGWSGFRYQYSQYGGGSLTAITNSEDERVEYDYLDGRLSRVTAIGEQYPIYRFAYSVNREAQLYSTLVDDPRGGRSVYRYDALMRLREVVDAVGDVTTTRWLGVRPSSTTDAAGVTTSWQYVADDLSRATLPSGNVIAYEYAGDAQNRDDPWRRPIRRISDLLGVVEERSYDAHGRLLTRTDGAGETTGFQYDEEGSLLAVVSPDGLATFFTDYGDDGHMRGVTRGSVYDRRTYDAVGNLLTGGNLSQATSPGRPGIVRRVFDEDRNLAALDLAGSSPAAPHEPVVATLTIESRSDGKRKRVTRPHGGDTELTYDALGRPVELRERVDGVWSISTFSYDAAGQLVASQSPNGMRSEVDRDVAGRESEIRLLRDGVLEKKLQVHYGAGRILSRFDSSYGAPELFEYDAAGRIVSLRFPAGEVLELGYDLRSREILRRFRAGEGGPLLRTLAFGYDGADRQIRLLDEGEVILERTLVADRPVAIRYGNGLERHFQYGVDSGLLLRSSTTDALGQSLEDTTLDWRECAPDMLCLIADSSVRNIGEGSGAGMGVTSESYVLAPPVQALAQEGGPGMRLLAWVPLAAPGAALASNRRYAYDELGNWLGIGVGSALIESFEYNPERNRLLSSHRQEHHAYAYDAAGYLVSRDGVTIAWDAGGRIASIGDDIELEWDVLGRPIRSLMAGLESRSLFGGLVQANAEGQPTAIDLGEVEILLGSDERVYRHLDFRKNVSFMTGQGGEVLVHHSYSPQGIEATRGSHPADRSFAGGGALGDFLLLGARLYDPETGRFISPDPIYHPINQYAYTLGNPVLLWDPTGLHAEPPTRVAAGKIADYLAALAIALIGAGLVTGSAVLVGAGAAVMIVAIGIVLILSVSVAAHASAGTPKGGVAPAGWGASPTSAASAPLPAPTAGCAPASLVSERGSAWPLGILIPLQLVLAALLLRPRRRDRSRG